MGALHRGLRWQSEKVFFRIHGPEKKYFQESRLSELAGVGRHSFGRIVRRNKVHCTVAFVASLHCTTVGKSFRAVAISLDERTVIW